MNSILNIIKKLRPIHRVMLSIIISGLIFIIVPSVLPVLPRILITWLGFAITYISICWITIFKMSVTEIIRKASIEDGSKTFVFLFVILASFACLFTVLLMVMGFNDKNISQWFMVLIAVGSMISSWALVHTLYTFHYAHLYYKTKGGKGLDYPGDEKPDYLDFAYFSFVMGCTFQVSDVEISSKEIRRVALFHGLLSFALNTFVVALTINIIAGLIH
ncbi:MULTISPECIES: DUF1345 domain-containing protein [Elizabethkingia]|uniref:DUF1345 domain-containing protein n=3 Tax=Elizabethkingia anophelis TaxID=1117645 RepID=A0A494J7S7_9FLAO|nr:MULTISPECIES: DUF1345 domain-containing protein [Elizabethkingia]MDX8558008.1 DUF1345 domain-containing protein [Elizabethkingia sp. HX CGY]OPB51795.1 hypothetical protein BAY09_11405 [Elizabethkingia anophelis]OPB82487.1 hypothetical protein BAX56_02055 [Elizabethkingia anophelis]OPC01588.1 hypothetical protein BAS08_07455 [Elizabethkingia anophelis]UXM67021.1 DUF1345 domain-containing protein [Elizabethkingia anophelis]